MKSSDVIGRLIVTLCVGAMAPPTALAQAFSADERADGHHHLLETTDRDRPGYGSLAAPTRMAQAAAPGRAQNLIGHWRNTRIVYGGPRDEHMVLRGNGLVETWSVTAAGRSGPLRGRWGTQANILSMEWEDGTQWSRPFTFHEGNLVFPNVQNQRKFWELIE